MKRDALDPKRIAAEIDMRCKAVNAIMQVRTTDKGNKIVCHACAIEAQASLEKEAPRHA